MIDQAFQLEKTSQQWDLSKVLNQILLVQDLAKLKPQSMEEFKLLNLLVRDHGLKELLSELSQEQELR